MSQSSEPCRFVSQPGGCRRGNSCRYSHDPGQAGPHRGARARGRGRGASAAPTGRGGVPLGFCNAFWSNGRCDRDFQCRYKHVQNPASLSGEGTASQSGAGPSVVESVVPFLTPAGLAKLSEPGTDGFFSNNASQNQSPAEVHNYLKRFLFDSYRFRTTQDIYGFLSLLGNVSASNEKWVSSIHIVHDESSVQITDRRRRTRIGLLRMNDIICWDPVSMQAGNQRTVLSFQRGYLPLLRYFSSDYVVKSITSHIVNALYNIIMENFDHFCGVITSCMEDAIDVSKTFKDPKTLLSSAKDPIGSQVIICLSKILFECITRFKNAIATHPAIYELVLHLQQWTEAWVAGISSTPPTFDDAFAKTTPQARDHIVRHLTNEVGKLVTIVERKNSELQRAKGKARSAPTLAISGDNAGILAGLENAYEGPGEVRPDGPRHDNDFVNIADIRIAPTHEELTSRHSPFLPGNLYDAPHPHPTESMQRLLDIQFRLLREELTATLRTSIQLVLGDLNVKKGKTRLSDVLQKRGGKYHGYVQGQDTVLFNIYTNAMFSDIIPGPRGISVSLSIDTPPGRARAPQASARATFWESMSSKRLMQGGLVALIWKRGETADVHLGTIATSSRDLSHSAKQDPERLSLKIAFFDPEVELRILHELRRPPSDRHGIKLLVEATVMYESIRPFLEALKVEPEIVPFGRYLVHRPPAFYKSLQISPPAYACIPGFAYQLACLFPADADVQDLRLRVSDPDSVEAARDSLRQSSRLDPSQADAVIEALTRELVLIQGPPGTGKASYICSNLIPILTMLWQSYTGVELLRVLITNKAGPILLIAFTNHALDHMLRSVLDAGITRRIVRLGSRSADETISQFSIETMESAAGKSSLERNSAASRYNLRDVENKIKELMKDVFKPHIDTEDILRNLEIQYPAHFESLSIPPPWISALHRISSAQAGGAQWQTVGRGGRAEEQDDSLYAYWRDGQDLAFISAQIAQMAMYDTRRSQTSQQPIANKYSVLYPEGGPHSPQVQVDIPQPVDENVGSSASSDESDDFYDAEDRPEEMWIHVVDEEDMPATSSSESSTEHDGLHDEIEVNIAESRMRSQAYLQPSDFENIQDFYAAFGCVETPTMPATDRSITDLLDFDVYDIWTMSQAERNRLDKYWTDEVRDHLQETRLLEFEQLRKRHEEALRNYNEARDEGRRQLLRNVDIIGCTTTGAAKLTSLLKGIGPRIMLVEEAGQVLEAHVLGSLVHSVQHLILIGDPLQLRPTVDNYSLSMDHPRGRMVFKFDMSLMERLATSGLPMSQINVQRRMRPAIADLVRTTLYPNLEDHDLVKNYPPVRGLTKNIFFFNHNHKENGGEDDSLSKFNKFEVDMIVDLVKYLLRQGTYSAEGDIVVLCAYLGQLSRLRDALSNEVVVIIDERDQAELDDRNAEVEPEQIEQASVEHVKIPRRVRLRTIDNYQGEEAKIVVLSLVRNSGGSDDDAIHGHTSATRPNIGFLRSKNRTNVALSRAREGLYIFGNAPDLSARSEMWRSIIEQLSHNDCVGDSLPVRCDRHPETVELISKPGQLSRIAPDGGCLRQCDSRLKCGHLCPYKCHSDDPNHLSVACMQRCTRLCVRGHPCNKQCVEQCGNCKTRVRNVELPCGHAAAEVYCYQLDDLSEVFCNVSVTRNLPHCDHLAVMRCSEEITNYMCRESCGGIMPCCGRNCAVSCHQCLALNVPPDHAEGRIARLTHVTHPCQKSLYCGHLCGAPCSQDHTCTTVCKMECRQVCVHARCKSYCSTPCVPCQEPCTWRCAHYACPVPCGSICARLPCDKRCEKVLRCGHRCPSVCGDDCDIQICPTCADQDVRNVVIDVIMQRTLSDLDMSQDTLDEVIITLPTCRHVFTVETLDGVCDMGAYYVWDDKTQVWTGLQAPPDGFQKPPSCPTCRAAITSPRYGRIFKRADLDILENNVAFHMGQSIGNVQMKVEAIPKQALEAQLQEEGRRLLASAANISTKQQKVTQKSQAAILKAKRACPLSLSEIDPLSDKLHGVPATEAKPWKKVVVKLLQAYVDVVKVAHTRSAHAHAWEASFAHLYQKEMDDAIENPMQAPRRPEEHAMRVARMKVGQPPPRADKRFLVEAFWVTITLRLTLAGLAGTWLDAIGTSQYPSENRRLWAMYIFFLLRSCAADAAIALEITKESESHRQQTRTSLLIMRIELEQFRFNMEMMRQNRTFLENRDRLLERAQKMQGEASQYVKTVVTEHRRARRQRLTEEEMWLTDNFTGPANVILEEWGAVDRSIRMDTFYQPLSLDEMTSVVKGLDFSHAGHFYKCPNGHTFVIADCGGAAETSYCPECGQEIGGTGHRLLPSNSRAVEFEEIARGLGASGNPWG
ncbi:P-loop containing nucleoside triphosphate hydrolase protein [Obba rivulosa]|uniref:P-loop containing nucleoside triphosphate hydrolase protein n=1 Tax=Obba rivulosa TaxID=1052685 RepID=A0A8E2B030_9APHY|nr:P-loop containing nucleoside triphosphate hydrolase protein [Obba rivulosa]